MTSCFRLLLLTCALPSHGLLSNQAHSRGEHGKGHNSNGWYMYFGDHRISEGWGAHTEIQLRRHHIIEDPQQQLIRAGLNQVLTPEAMLINGYGFIETPPTGTFLWRALSRSSASISSCS